MTRVIVLDNPLAKYWLTVLRDKNTDPIAFRNVLKKIGFILGYEIARYLDWSEHVVETPLSKTIGLKPSCRVYVVGILGASIPLVEGIIEAIPWAGIGLIAAKRFEEEDKVTIKVYYERLINDLSGYTVVIADPMLATGYTMSEAIKRVREKNARKIIVATIISSRQGLKHIIEKHKEVTVVTLAIDPELNDKWFIVPGLGDAGDRALNPTDPSIRSY